MIKFLQPGQLQTLNIFTKKTVFSFFVFLLTSTYLQAQQVTEIITDFGGYWRTNTTTNNATKPNDGHNLLAFTVGGTLYSTGANNTTLTSKGVSFTTGNYKCLPITSVTGSITSVACAIGLAINYDGAPAGYSTPLPTVKMKDVLTDGTNGLNLGTGVIDIPTSAKLTFPVQSIDANSIADAKPDILFTQIADPDPIKTDTMYFVNSANVVVGNKIVVSWSSVQVLGTYLVDFYDLQRNVPCDQAVITGGIAPNNTRPIRLTAFKLSDFGINSTNKASVASLVLQPSGKSDIGFVAYNTDGFVIAPPTITQQPQTQVVCTGAASVATFSVVATGTSDTYQWRKNDVSIPGATGTVYTISPVTASSAGAYDVVVTNPGGTVTSTKAYLNTEITKQPVSQTIVTGNTVTLSVTATNTTGYQWKKNGVDIAGAVDSIYTISPMERADSGLYTVRAINNANAGCASVTSNAAALTAAIVVYSKSSPDINIPSTWGANTDGSGSTPVDFTRAEHTFVLSNRPWGNTLTNLTIAGTLDVKNGVAIIADNTTLDVGRSIRTGTGSISGSTSSGFTTRGNSDLYFTIGSQFLKNFTVAGGTVNMLSDLVIAGGTLPGKINITGGTLAVGTNKITIRSTSTLNTSMVTAVGPTASVTYGSGGAFIVERFIPANRSFRFMSPTVTTITSIKNNWMEGVVNPDRWNNYNPNPGYGTHITGPKTASDSLDPTQTYNPSLFTFDNDAQSWNPVPNSSGTLTAGTPYRFMIRGSRAVDLNNNEATPSNTIIRATGSLLIGTKTVGSSVLSKKIGGYSFVGNPYACPVNWNTLTTSGLSSTYYGWDEAQSKRGAYVSYNGYSLTSSNANSALNENIQSGQAFFVQSTSTTPSITFNETNKSYNNTAIFRGANTMTKLSVQLLLDGEVGNHIVADGFVAVFGSKFSNRVSEEDSYKFTNLDENIAIDRNGVVLSIEGRPDIIDNDTIPIKIWQFRQKDYFFKFDANDFNSSVTATLKDDYLKQQYSIDLSSSTTIPFSITEDSASFASNRFSIVFAPAKTLPVIFTNVKAYQKEKCIQVEWNTSKETNIKEYEVEKSLNGQDFKRVFTTSAKADSQLTNTYSWLDKNATIGKNFYRIKIIEKAGKAGYSSVVKVIVNNDKSGFTIFPNPVKGKLVHLQLANLEGKYVANIFNDLGQQVYQSLIQINQGTTSQTLLLDGPIGKGKFTIQLSNDKTTYSKPLILQ
ncbi:immunoglobulin domain-containing protein [Segetibacter aerophilus]|uniref:Ig-like domain-containing protein n=1 Tax=Segetibacter aerophilus TaxID=670293 RepID=A0A512BEE6_9BACT|nr:immunoglobulin domain-containing protein [Segetibacter aerophilus]GEO10324.1 hypothetical protein SAE01_28200 [Segetibacter aerophilus]